MSDERATAITVIAVSRAGSELARRLRAALPEVRVRVPERFAQPGDEPYAGRAREAVAEAFAGSSALVLVMAAGAAVRLIAPLVDDKRGDPAVVVVDDAGRFAVSLLSGHLGGANRLAEAVARALGSLPVVTTASEAAGVPSPDLIGREWGWRIDPRGDLTVVAAALVNGEPVGVVQECGRTDWLPEPLPQHIACYPTVATLLEARPAAALIVSDRAELTLPPWLPAVVYRPPVLVVGVGASRGAPADESIALAEAALSEGGFAVAAVGAVATIELKRDEPGVLALAAHLDAPLITYSALELEAAPGDWTRSELVRRATGAGGVCEPAALLAAGATMLAVPKRRSVHATIAIARRGRRQSAVGSTGGRRQSAVGSREGTEPPPDSAATFGTARSSATPDRVAGAAPETNSAPPAACRLPPAALFLVGTGPGDPRLLTRQAEEVLRSVDVVLGYTLYLDLLRPALPGLDYRPSPITHEEERAREAVALALAGKRVALVGSGDAGVYGLAGLALEVLEALGRDDLPVEVVPGVTAALSAAALLGAPLGHDFCTISLSDLLTPWGAIRGRLEAAAAAGFVTVLYNPASARRRWQLREARRIFLGHRAPDTPIGIVANAFRQGERVRLTTLDGLAAEEVDMLTTVLIGSSATRRWGERLITPRGYRVRQTITRGQA